MEITSNDPTVVTTTELDPSIEVTKTATITDNGDGITGLEDVINYTITVENTGNTILEALGLVDTLSDISGNSLNPYYRSSICGIRSGIYRWHTSSRRNSNLYSDLCYRCASSRSRWCFKYSYRYRK